MVIIVTIDTIININSIIYYIFFIFFTSFIVWDESTMSNKGGLEALDQTLIDFRNIGVFH